MVLHARLNTPPSYLSGNATNDTPAIVIVHGLAGDINEYQHKIAALAYADAGYAVYRIALYGNDPHTRKLRHSTIGSQARDIRDVLHHLAGVHNHLYLSGHSYGGATIMSALADAPALTAVVRAISLWDPSFDLPRVWELLPARHHGAVLVEGDGVEICLNPAMMDELHFYDREQCLAMATRVSAPVQVIHAEGCIYNAPDEISWHSINPDQNERHLVVGADHDFCEGDTAQQAINLTLSWFNRH